jgi:hypothetical protein
MDTSAGPTPAAGPRAASARVSGRRDNASARVGPQAAHGLEQLLTRGLAVGYQPRLPIHSARFGDQLYFHFYEDVEWMCRDDAVRLPLQFVMGPAAHAEWGVEARTPAEALFVAQQLQWFWSNAVPLVQEEAYPFGWCAGEPTYDVHDGLLVQSGFTTFNPRDADPAIDPETKKPCEVWVRNTEAGTTKLWAYRQDIPNKAFWYAHLARRGQRRGQSQVWAAYRPWLRLTGRDGGEELIDLGMYRLGVPIIIVDHPNQAYTAAPGKGQPYAQNGYTHTRDEARAIAENVKAGAGVAVASGSKNGVRDWDLRVEQAGVNGAHLIEYVEYLERKCYKGVGVPPELLQAAESGSGYSGRAIPLEGFLTSQQRPVNDLTRSWFDQIGQPLLRWNYGPDAWARVTPKPLLGSYKKNAWDSPGQQPPPGGPPGAPPGAPPGGAPMATMSTGFGPPGGSSLFVRAGGEIYNLRPVSVSVPDMAFLSTETPADDVADRLAALSDRDLAALAGPDTEAGDD